MRIGNEDFYERTPSNGEGNSPQMRWAQENAQAQRTHDFEQPVGFSFNPNGNLGEAAQNLIGYSRTLTDNAGSGGVLRRWINRSLPQGYPADSTPDNASGNSYLFCTSIPQANGVGASIGLDPTLQRSAYSRYRINSVWETLPYNVVSDDDPIMQPATGPLSVPSSNNSSWKPDEGTVLANFGWTRSRYVSKQIDPGTLTQSIPNGYAKFAADETLALVQAPVNFPVTVSRWVVHYVWHMVPYDGIPFAGLRQLGNTVNNASFDGFPTGTLLFQDPKIRLYRSAFGNRVADLQYNMIFRPNYDNVTGTYRGWNSFLRVVGGKRRYWWVSADGSIPSPASAAGVPIFEYSDFTALFRPDQT